MRTVDLWRYLPGYLKDFKELKALFEAEKSEFQMLDINQNNLLNDLFIDTASENGVSRFEKLLGITDTSGDLERRRATVLAKWWNIAPYTMRSLKNRIITIQGNDNVRLEFDNEDIYVLHVTTHLEKTNQINDLIYILQTMCPANMSYTIENMATIEAKADIINGIGMTTVVNIQVASDIDWTDYSQFLNPAEEESENEGE